MTSDEVWRSVVGHPRYSVSSTGQVMSYCRKIPKLLKPHLLRDHYGVTLDGRSDYVHRIVLRTFVGECPPGMECRHLDGNPVNNSVENLVWGTQSENWKDRRTHDMGDCFGERHYKAKLTLEQVERIRGTTSTLLKDLANEYDVSISTIQQIKSGRIWKDIASAPEFTSTKKRLTKNQVSEIRMSVLSDRDLSEKYSVHHRHIYRIRKGITWVGVN